MSAATVTPIKPEPTEAAKKAKRLVYAALEDYYDDTQRRYRPGHTDKSIGEELGVAEAFVKAIREADYGPLAAPSDVEEIGSAINALTSELGKLRGRFDTLVTKNGWKL